ncbi:MAG: hypothetical protein WCA81_17060, partial [Rhizomicrobium sp.]
MTAAISLVVSVISICVSALTAWLTLLRRGAVHMTQPTVIYFGPDGGSSHDDGPRNKIFPRALLYSTAKRGNIVESMYVRLRRNETTQNFNIWVYGDKQLLRGSGLFVPDTGVATNHHFLLPDDGAGFTFLAGRYFLEVFVVAVGDRKARRLFSVELVVSPEVARALEQSEEGLYFDWGPD